MYSVGGGRVQFLVDVEGLSVGIQEVTDILFGPAIHLGSVGWHTCRPF